MKDMRVLLMTAAGCMLFAASVHAAATSVLTETFDTPGDITTYTGGATWTGSGNVEASDKSYTATAGLPVTDANGNVLVVSGSVKAALTTPTTVNNLATVDMMVQIAKPDDTLELPSSESITDIQIAVGAENDGTLKVYCTPASGSKGWYSLGSTVYAEGTWHRVSFTFDYTAGRCLVSVDGVAAATASGYVTASGTTTGGAWYKLANTPVANQLSSVAVVGSTSIDDLVVKHAASVSDALPAIADGTSPAYNGGNVTKAWLLEQGISASGVTASTAAPDGSGMTLNGKYVAGYTAVDGKKFELKDMTLSGSTATVKFNEANIPAGYKYVIEAADNPSFTGASSTVVTDAAGGSANIEMGSGNVKYYRIKVTTAE